MAEDRLVINILLKVEWEIANKEIQNYNIQYKTANTSKNYSTAIYTDTG